MSVTSPAALSRAVADAAEITASERTWTAQNLNPRLCFLCYLLFKLFDTFCQSSALSRAAANAAEITTPERTLVAKSSIQIFVSFAAFCSNSLRFLLWPRRS